MLLGSGAFNLGVKGGYLGGCSDECGTALYIHSTSVGLFDTTPYISTANHYEYFDIVDHALRLVDFKSSTIPFLFLGTLIQQS